MRMSAMIKIENVSKVYGKGKKNQVQALKSIALELEQGHNYAIIGKSGSGKSTLMNMIGLLDLPTEGKIFFKGSDISHYNAGQQAKYRNMEVGFVYQDFRLIDELTAKENILLPRLIAKKKIDMEYYHSLISMLGLEEREKHLPTELSGGQKQRVAIARALINDPDLILADEPTGNVDQETAGEIMDIFVQMHQLKKTVVIVTHDMEHVLNYCDNVVVVDNGEILQKTTVQEFFRKTDLLKQLNILPPAIIRTREMLNQRGFHLSEEIMDIKTLAKAIQREVKTK